MGDLVEIIKSKLNTTNIINIQLLSSSNFNSRNYAFFADGKKYFLKSYYNKNDFISNKKNLDKVIKNYENIYLFLQKLKKTDFNLISPINFFVINKIYFEIYDFIDFEKFEYNSNIIDKIINNLSKLHNSNLFFNKNEDFYDFLKKLIFDVKNSNLNNLQVYFNEIFLNLKYLKWGLCHGDFHENNIVYHKRKIFFIDFDDMVFSPVILDISSLISSFNYDYELSISLLKKYMKEVKINKIDLKMIKNFCILREYSQFKGFLFNYKNLVAKAILKNINNILLNKYKIFDLLQ